MEDPAVAVEVRQELPHDDAGWDGVAALSGPGVATELELVGGAVGCFALDAEGVVSFDAGADAVDGGGVELEAADAVAAVEGEGGEGCGEGGVGWGGVGGGEGGGGCAAVRWTAAVGGGL